MNAFGRNGVSISSNITNVTLEPQAKFSKTGQPVSFRKPGLNRTMALLKIA